MKTLATIIGLLAICASALVAQEYKSRQPKASEERRIAGLTDYIQDGERANFTLYIPGAEEQYTLGETNNFIAFRSIGALTNVVVVLPNATNTARRVYTINANGNVTVKLTNTVGVTYNTATNVTALTTWTSATNCTFRVLNNNRTNWFIVPVS
jgi:subtilase family serine protease